MEIINGNLRIIVTENSDEMSRKAAEFIAAEMNSNKNCVLGLPTGGTPVGTYKELIKMNQDNKVDFSGVTTFNLDEYYPITKDNDQSYYYFMHDNLFNHVNIDKSKVNILNGEAPDWEAEVKEYEDRIVKAGGIDLQVLGIGNNGHIAFNEPADCFAGYTSKVAISESTIEANARFFASPDDVPREALSMGIRSIMMAKKILLIASGKGKKEVLRKTFYENVTPQVPASVLQFHRDVTFIIDKEAYSEI